MLISVDDNLEKIVTLLPVAPTGNEVSRFCRPLEPPAEQSRASKLYKIFDPYLHSLVNKPPRIDCNISFAGACYVQNLGAQEKYLTPCDI